MVLVGTNISNERDQFGLLLQSFYVTVKVIGFETEKMAIFLLDKAIFEFDAGHRAKKLPKYGRKLTFSGQNGRDLNSYHFTKPTSLAARRVHRTQRNAKIGVIIKEP
jgi:hypothetical protein